MTLVVLAENKNPMQEWIHQLIFLSISSKARAVREGFGGSKFQSKQGAVVGPSLQYEYHNYDDLTSYLRNVNSMFPNITALYSIGKSVQGKCSSNYNIIIIKTVFEQRERVE